MRTLFLPVLQVPLHPGLLFDRAPQWVDRVGAV